MESISEKFGEAFHLNLEGLYYHSALEKLKELRSDGLIWKDLLDNISSISKKLHDGTNKANIKQCEDDILNLLEKNHDKCVPVIEKISMIHILSVLCLEAYINRLGNEHIPQDIGERIFKFLSSEDK